MPSSAARAQQPDAAKPTATPAPHAAEHRAEARRKGRPVHGTAKPPVVEPASPAHPIRLEATAKPAAKPAPVAAPAVAVPHPASPPVDESKGSVTGLPLPRWASLRPDEVNLRVGPGTRYEIQWVYKRRDLPVRILREFGPWRLVEDQDLIKGWVHSATLIGHRDLVVIGAERSLRDAEHDGAATVALLKPGVIGRIRSCEAASNWCEVQIADYRGFLKRDEFWGTTPGEAVP